MDFKFHKIIFFLPWVILWAIPVFSQTTYYSRNAASNPRDWDDANSWTLNADGSGPAAGIPQQIDNVVILAGHTIEIDGLTDNGGPSSSPDGLGLSNVGSFASSGAQFFYQTGNVNIEEGGSLISINTKTMFAGTTFVAGDFTAGDDIVNLGIMFFTATASFSSADDFILSGFSNTRMDIPSAANSFTSDDIYLDHTDAWLCGLGIIEVDVGGAVGIINLNNGADYNQICSNLTIIGCEIGPCVGTGTFNPTPPVLSGAGTTLNYIENAVTQINPAITLTYGELFLSQATVSLNGTYVNGEDVLAMIPTAGISALFNTGTGTLTLSGYGTIATWETALQNVTYENMSDNPSIGVRTAGFQITDGFGPSNIETRNIEITPVNDPPDVSTISGSPTPLAYTEGDPAVSVDDQIEVADPDDINLEGAVITITTNYVNGEDVLDFTNTVDITGNFVPADGKLTLVGTASLADYQIALRNVTYENLSEDPSELTRTVSFVVDDGDAVTPIPFTRDIEVTAVNDAPIITSTAGTTAIEETLYTYTATVNDPDDPNNGTDLTWSLSNEPAGMVVSITGEVTWTPAEGVLTSGAVTLTVQDGGENGSVPDTEVFTITVTPVNDPPMITSTAPASATEDMLYTYTATVTDPDDSNNGTDLTWSLSNEPTGMVVSTTGEVTWTPGEGILTSGIVTLTVQDGGENGAAPDTEDFTISVTPINDPPIISSTAPTNATEDILYTYTATVNDPDDANNGTDLTWSLSNEPSGMVVSSTGEVTWTPGEGFLTSGTVTLTVQDGGENGAAPDTEDFTITVTSVNDPPVITSTAPTTAIEETLYTYTATVNDPDDTNNGTDLTWSLSNQPTGMVVSTTGEVTWTPGEGVLTSGAVTLSVQDGGEDGAAPGTEDFTITVTPVNDPPMITSTAPVTATEDILYTYTATVTDVDDANNGIDLVWSLSNEPAGMVVSTTGEVTWTPTEGVLTSGTVTLTVQDGGENGAAPDTEDFTITVTPVNDPPMITSTAPTSAIEETLYTYTATVNDSDDTNNGTDLTWSLSNQPAGMVVSTTGEVTWTPGEGVLTSGAVTLSVQDGGEDGAAPGTEDFTISVTSVNDPPAITSTAPTTATEDILYTYTATVTDVDDANNGTDLTWSLANEPLGMVVSATGEVTWTPLEGILTSGTVTLTVQDGGENGAAPDTEDFTIVVTPVNDSPVITSTAPLSGTESVLYTYTAIGSDPDDANNGTDLTWSLTNEPTGMVVSSTGVVTWTPSIGTITSGTVTLTVVDGGEDASVPGTENFTISVTIFNNPPVITSTAPTNGTEDILYTYTPTVNDPNDPNDGVNLTWTLTNEPAGMTVSPTGVITWTPGDGVLTSGTVTLTVLDGGENGAAPDTEDFVITVTAVNDPPVVTGSSLDQTFTEGNGPIAVDDQMMISDLDDTNMEMATIGLGATFIASEDLLGFTDQSGITGAYNGATGELVLTGSATIADYISALAGITYDNSSINPDISTRTVSFVVNDGDDNSLTFTRDILIVRTNKSPVVVNSTGTQIDTVRFTINEDEVSTLCILTSDPETNTVRIESITSSSNGFANGTTGDLCFNYSPDLNFNGVVYASITICDDGDPVACGNAVVEITIFPVNDPPVAVDDEFNGLEDEVVTGNVMDNDSDPDGDVLKVDIAPVNNPLNGVVVLNEDGSFTYTPDKDFAGQDFFSYRICDSANPVVCDDADVTINLQNVEDPLVVYQALTPNDDAFNDSWVIEGIEQYPGNRVQIFDRWNALVYQVEGYDNTNLVWSGESNSGISKGELPDGTYFYVINLGNGSKALDGFVELRR